MSVDFVPFGHATNLSSDIRRVPAALTRVGSADHIEQVLRKIGDSLKVILGDSPMEASLRVLTGSAIPYRPHMTLPAGATPIACWSLPAMPGLGPFAPCLLLRRRRSWFLHESWKEVP